MYIVNFGPMMIAIPISMIVRSRNLWSSGEIPRPKHYSLQNGYSASPLAFSHTFLIPRYNSKYLYFKRRDLNFKRAPKRQTSLDSRAVKQNWILSSGIVCCALIEDPTHEQSRYIIVINMSFFKRDCLHVFTFLHVRCWRRRHELGRDNDGDAAGIAMGEATIVLDTAGRSPAPSFRTKLFKRNLSRESNKVRRASRTLVSTREGVNNRARSPSAAISTQPAGGLQVLSRQIEGQHTSEAQDITYTTFRKSGEEASCVWIKLWSNWCDVFEDIRLESNDHFQIFKNYINKVTMDDTFHPLAVSRNHA